MELYTKNNVHIDVEEQNKIWFAKAASNPKLFEIGLSKETIAIVGVSPSTKDGRLSASGAWVGAGINIHQYLVVEVRSKVSLGGTNFKTLALSDLLSK